MYAFLLHMPKEKALADKNPFGRSLETLGRRFSSFSRVMTLGYRKERA